MRAISWMLHLLHEAERGDAHAGADARGRSGGISGQDDEATERGAVAEHDAPAGEEPDRPVAPAAEAAAAGGGVQRGGSNRRPGDRKRTVPRVCVQIVAVVGARARIA